MFIIFDLFSTNPPYREWNRTYVRAHIQKAKRINYHGEKKTLSLININTVCLVCLQHFIHIDTTIRPLLAIGCANTRTVISLLENGLPWMLPWLLGVERTLRAVMNVLKIS